MTVNTDAAQTTVDVARTVGKALVGPLVAAVGWASADRFDAEAAEATVDAAVAAFREELLSALTDGIAKTAAAAEAGVRVVGLMLNGLSAALDAIGRLHGEGQQ